MGRAIVNLSDLSLSDLRALKSELSVWTDEETKRKIVLVEAAISECIKFVDYEK